MEFEQPVPSSAGSASDEAESAVSSTLFFEKEDVILIVDDVSLSPSCTMEIFNLSLEECGYARIHTQNIQPLRNYPGGTGRTWSFANR
jgi:hypothetical protein